MKLTNILARLAREGCKPKITRKEMKDVALFADMCEPNDKKKWKVSKRAAKRLAKRPVRESNITRMDMKDVALFADDAIPNDKDKWKVSTRAAKRKFGEASSEAKKRYIQKHYRESGGTFK